ncbi:hypothetical protein HDU86_001298 [Geranomyces michiganensis]|nr:hypothetical protein HDU86_001298 [Geranomyces michiganensis]
MPGVTVCSASGCTTLPGQSQIPYNCDAPKPCLYTIGYDECVEDYQYPSPAFDVFSNWSSTPTFQPARGQNGSFYYAGLTSLDATQSLTVPNLAIQTGKFDLNHSQFPGGSWNGPFWPELPESTSSASTPLYTWPFKPSEGGGRPWRSFPFLPDKPVSFAPSNTSLDALISGGIWAFATWPAVAISVDNNWANAIPWITFPYLRDAVPDDRCSQPPASGKIDLYGFSTRIEDGIKTFVGGTPLQAWVSIDNYKCTGIHSDSSWLIDMSNASTASGIFNRQDCLIDTNSLTAGLHNLTARTVFTTMEGFLVSTVVVTVPFRVRPVTFTVALSLQNITVPAAWPLLLNATSSHDTYSPCLFLPRESELFWKCVDLHDYGDFWAVMVFACTTISGTPCPLGIKSTVGKIQQINPYGLFQSNSSYASIFVQSTASALIMTTDVPYLQIPASALVEGTYIFTFSYKYLGGLSSPASAPVAITVSSQKHYCDYPPRQASMTFPGKTGAGIPDFIAGRGGQAILVVSPFSCPNVGTIMIFWGVDTKIDANPVNSWLPQAGETQTDSLSWSSRGDQADLGIHKITGRIVYFTDNSQYLTTLVVTGTVNLIAPTFKPLLTNTNSTVSISRPLTLDATATTDNIDPCVLKRYTSDVSYRTCRSNNPSVTPYLGPMIFVWICRTPSHAACLFPFNSTITSDDIDDLFNGHVSSNSTFEAILAIPLEKYNLTEVVTDVPTLTLPPESLVAGDYLWTVTYFYGDSNFGPRSESPAVAITVSSSKSWLTLPPIVLGTQQTTFIAGTLIRVSANASSDSVSSSWTYIWTVSDTSGTQYNSAIVSTTSGTSSINYFKDGVETSVKYPGTVYEELLLPAASNGSVSIYVRQFISGGKLAPSDPQILPVTVTQNPGTAADLAASLTNLLTGGNTGQSAAAMDGFVGKLQKLNLSDSSTQTMVGNVVNALTSQVSANVDGPTAVSQTSAIGKLLATGAVSDASKRNASIAIQTLASVLATPGIVVAKSTLESAAAACLNAAVANSTDSGDAVVGSFGFLGAALMNTLAVGESATLNIPGALLKVLSIDPDAIPETLSSGSLSRRDSASTCDADIKGTVGQILTASGSGAAVSVQANCLSGSPYPIDNSAVQTDVLK